MPETTEEQPSGGLDLQRYLDLIRRRHMQFLIPAFLGWLVVWAASWMLPVRYKSGTTILVDQPTMPKDYVAPNVNDDMQQRLQSIKQQVLSRTRLLLIIDKFQLYSGDRRRLSPDEKAGLMSSDIDIDLVQDPLRDQINGFKISYSAHDPHVAQKVAAELTDLFISENNKVHQQESEDTTKFLEGQMEIAQQHLKEQEAKVRAFEAAHEGELPTQQTSNIQILAGLQTQLQSEQDSLNSAKQQRSYLQTLIEQQSRSNARVPVRSVDGTPTGLAAIDQDLENLRSKLADLRSRYTENYPDVQSLKEQIARTEKMRETVAAEQKNLPGAAKPTEDLADATASAELLQLKGQLQANQTEIANREQAISALKARINQYQVQLEGEPATEQQLTDLTRGYEQSKQDYDGLVKRHNESQMATSMEQMQQGERFTMLDAATVPLKPDFPNRLKFCGIGLGVGIGLGLVVVFAMEFFDDRLHSEKQIKTLLPTIVLSELPEVLSPSDERSIKSRMMLGWATAAVVLVMMLAGSAYSYLRG
jgi:polysaccharide biosynthesis transport protein